MKREEVVQELRGSNEVLQEYRSLDADLLKQRYREGSWTGVELISHLADTEAIFYARFLVTASGEATDVVSFDEDRMVKELGGDRRPVGVSLEAIGGLRKSLIFHVETLNEEALNRTATHGKFGELSALKMARIVAWHTVHHLTQLAALRDGREWSKDEAISYRE